MLRICSRRNWTLSQWWALPDDEKDIWIAHDLKRRDALNSIKDMLRRKKHLSPEVLVALMIDGL